MMLLPFIGRKEELERIESLIMETDTFRVVCVDAPGGFGKTRLLQEISSKCAIRTDLLIAEIIDFDDDTLQIPENLGFTLSGRLGLSNFRKYIQAYKDYRLMERGGLGLQRLEQERRVVTQKWIDEFNLISKSKRIIYLIDTYDKIEDVDTFDYLMSLLGNKNSLKNVCFVIAGRTAKSIWERLHPHLEDAIQLIELDAFNKESSIAFLEAKANQIFSFISPDVADKIIYLSQGRPIILDLAIEWIARNKPLNWFFEYSKDQLEQLPKGILEHKINEFEMQLVTAITKTKQPIDNLIVKLSHVYPLNIELIMRLLDYSQEEAGELFFEARQHTFIKSTSDKTISLHDEMRRLVQTHVWADLDEGWQEHDSTITAQYLASRIEYLERLSLSKSKSVEELGEFTNQEAQQRELWDMKVRWLHHVLVYSLRNGASAFIELFEEATKANRFSYRDRIVHEIQPYLGKVNSSERYSISAKYSKHLIDRADYKAAEKILDGLAQSELAPAQKIEILLLLGDVKIRQGNNLVGLSDFEEATLIARTNRLVELLGRTLLSVGWAYRIIGDWPEADKNYVLALEIAQQSADQSLKALVLNSLAFVRSSKDIQQALRLSDSAIRIWTKQNNTRRLGYAYSTRGSLLYQASLYEDAALFFEKALAIAEQEQSLERTGIILSAQAVNLWAKVQTTHDENERRMLLRKAEALLKRALEINVIRDEAKNLHRLSRVLKSKGDLDGAWRVMWQAYEKSIAISDLLYEVAALRDLLAMALDSKRFEIVSELSEKVESCKNILIPMKYNSPTHHAFAQALVNLGLLKSYIGSDEAYELIAEGFQILATHYTDFAYYSLSNVLSSLLEKSKDLPSHQKGNLSKYLVEYWKTNKLDHQFPEVFAAFYELGD